MTRYHNHYHYFCHQVATQVMMEVASHWKPHCNLFHQSSQLVVRADAISYDDAFAGKTDDGEWKCDMVMKVLKAAYYGHKQTLALR